jgi:hypothetical protein
MFQLLGKTWWKGWSIGVIAAFAFVYIFDIKDNLACFFIGFSFTSIPAWLAKWYFE